MTPDAPNQHLIPFAWGTLLVLLLAQSVGLVCSASSETPRRLDPAAWGSDHVGKPVPEYTTGDECLFCHREKIGTSWGKNRHNLTIRLFEESSPVAKLLKPLSDKIKMDEIKYVLGHHQRQRFLKPAKGYGQLELLSVEWAPKQDGKSGKLLSSNRPHWDTKKFADSCAGCHTTGVDPKEKTFSSVSLDCFVCHGQVPTEHAKKPTLAYFATKRKIEPQVVTSICAGCHLRSGKSKNTGLPYPTNFVPGDNLFRDFQVDFSDKALMNLSTADRHILENVRDVVVFDNKATCLNCHDVHKQSSKKHRLVPTSDICLTCHNAKGPKSELKPFSIHSKTCGY